MPTHNIEKQTWHATHLPTQEKNSIQRGVAIAAFLNGCDLNNKLLLLKCNHARDDVNEEE